MLFSFFLMVVFVIDISNILTFEPECDPPVALTLTDQVPLRSPISGCRFRPGKAISVEFIETFSRPKINRMLEADDHARSISAPAGLLRGLRNAVTPLHSPDRPHTANRCLHHCFRRPLVNRFCGGESTTAHDGQAITHAEKLRQIRTDHQDRSVLRGALRDRFIDLGLTPDVDAARRLVEQKHVSVLMKQTRERQLLLIAARECTDGLPNAAR